MEARGGRAHNISLWRALRQLKLGRVPLVSYRSQSTAAVPTQGHTQQRGEVLGAWRVRGFFLCTLLLVLGIMSPALSSWVQVPSCTTGQNPEVHRNLILIGAEPEPHPWGGSNKAALSWPGGEACFHKRPHPCTPRPLRPSHGGGTLDHAGLGQPLWLGLGAKL